MQGRNIIAAGFGRDSRPQAASPGRLRRSWYILGQHRLRRLDTLPAISPALLVASETQKSRTVMQVFRPGAPHR
jgi:hypothetical protein